MSFPIYSPNWQVISHLLIPIERLFLIYSPPQWQVISQLLPPIERLFPNTPQYTPPIYSSPMTGRFAVTSQINRSFSIYSPPMVGHFPVTPQIESFN